MVHFPTRGAEIAPPFSPSREATLYCAADIEAQCEGRQTPMGANLETRRVAKEETMERATLEDMKVSRLGMIEHQNTLQLGSIKRGKVIWILYPRVNVVVKGRWNNTDYWNIKAASKCKTCRCNRIGIFQFLDQLVC